TASPPAVQSSTNDRGGSGLDSSCMIEGTSPALLEGLDGALAELLRQLAVRTPGGEVHEDGGILAIVGAVPSPVIVNTILTMTADATPDAFDRAVALYAAHNHEFNVMSRDHADGHLEPTFAAAGLRRLFGLPGMIVEERLPERPRPAEGCEIRTVQTEADRAAWVRADLAGFAEGDADRQAIESAFGEVH